MQRENQDGVNITQRRHSEWQEYQIRWRWLLDSYEGGERYREAIYGYEHNGRVPVRNLIRHKREYPDPRELSPIQSVLSVPPTTEWLGGLASGRQGSIVGLDPYTFASDDDYELRRARTPIPTFMAEAIDGHLAHIYDREIVRKADPAIEDWWLDVDGLGTPIDRYMQETVAPLVLACGCLDLIFENPPAPDGEPIETQADVRRLELDRCVVGYIIPENMVWWRIDLKTRRYLECVVREYNDGLPDPAEDQGIVKPKVNYRHWEPDKWTLYDDKGEKIVSKPHPFGVVPIVRVFDRRLARKFNLSWPRYEAVAEIQREYYNVSSELVLTNTQHAHPLLQGPEDYVQADGTVPIGPSWLLPKKKNVQGGTASYEGFSVVEFPTAGAANLRAELERLEDNYRRYTHQVRPAGSAPAKSTLEQSGISKAIDHQAAHKQLAQIASSLERCERVMAEFAMLVLTGGNRAEAAAAAKRADLVYPQDFDLYSVSDVAVATGDFQQIAMRTGMGVPETEKSMLKRMLRLARPGLDDPTYRKLDSEIDAFIDQGGGLAMMAQAQADQKQLQAEQAMSTLSPAGNVRNGVQAPPTLNPPGQGGGNTSSSP